VGWLPEGPVLAADYCEPTKIVGIKRRAGEMEKHRSRNNEKKGLMCVFLRADRNERADDCRSPKWSFAKAPWSLWIGAIILTALNRGLVFYRRAQEIDAAT